MKHILVMVALAAAIVARGQDLTRVEIKSPADVAAIAAIPEWKRGADTNGITISVCVGSAILHNRYGNTVITLARDLEFDADGRLARISPVRTTHGLSPAPSFEKVSEWTTYQETPAETNVIRRTRRTRGQPREPRLFLKPPSAGK